MLCYWNVLWLCLLCPLYVIVTHCNELETLLITLMTCYVIVILFIVPCTPNMTMIMTRCPLGSPPIFMFPTVTFRITAYPQVATYAYSYAYAYDGYTGAHDKKITTSPIGPVVGLLLSIITHPFLWYFFSQVRDGMAKRMTRGNRDHTMGQLLSLLHLRLGHRV